MSAQTAEISSSIHPQPITQTSSIPSFSLFADQVDSITTPTYPGVETFPAYPSAPSTGETDQRNIASPPHPSTLSFHQQPSHTGTNDHPSVPPADSKPAIQAKKGSDGYWRMAAAPNGSDGQGHPLSHALDVSGPSTPADTGVVTAIPPVSNVKGIKLNFKRPTPATPTESLDGKSRDGMRDSPGSVEGGSSKKRRRILEVAPNPLRASRSRNSSPPRVNPAPVAQPAPRQPSSSTPGPSAPPANHLPASLQIFAPPPDSALPQALQDVLKSSSSRSSGLATGKQPDVGGDTLVREAGEGFESRRSARSRPAPATETVRAGVSASGKGVKVGGVPKEKDGGRAVRKKGKSNVDIPNQDFCSACRGIGKFLCCDGCPRSFHFMCLEPPLRVDELPEEEEWFCKECRADRSTRRQASPAKDNKDPRPIPTTFKQMIRRIDDENPAAFKLPQDIRQFFAGTATDGRGNYVDEAETRTKYDRKGFQEERDGTRLRDQKARPVSCYVCGGSSIPLRSLTTDPESTWRQIVSCDYCALHWHLDCLSPPLASMPNSGRKWMCPNHAEQVMARRRTVRNNLETVDVGRRGTPNNGNITVVPDENAKQIFDFEDMIINKRKYRVPEKIIRLDFWDKLGLGKGGKKVPPARGGDGVFKRKNSSSSLTTLGTEGGDEDDEMSYDETVGFEPSQADVDAANLVLSLFSSTPRSANAATGAGSDEIPSASSRSVPLSALPSNIAAEVASKRESSQPLGDSPSAGSPSSTSSGRVNGSPSRSGHDGPKRIMLKVSRLPQP